jgi:alpha-L-fucosidase
MRAASVVYKRAVVAISLLAGFALFTVDLGQAQDLEPQNKPDRLEEFQDLAVGMFIHWSLDSQLGMVISHSMVGASEDYLKRFVNELPETFNPKKYDADEWARLARVCGLKYAVFTTKHHSGFCMFHSETTDFGIANTPYREDISRQYVDAFRSHGIRVGFYFSPDDFQFLWKQGTLISRRRPEALPANNPELMRHNLAQTRELLTNYGPIEFLFIDGEPEGIRELAWQLQPNLVVTRGAMETPEQEIPDQPIPGPWEACFTMGTQWQFKPTNEEYKSGGELIRMLIETRAKGGNLLINVGPQPDGEIPFEQSRRLRELGLWLFINGEAIYRVRPWHVIREDNIWFTRAKDADTLYAIVTGYPDWQRGERKQFVIKSARATEQTVVSVLGQNSRVLEYRPEVNPECRWKQEDNGLHVDVMPAQRIYNMGAWPNPIVLKITHVTSPNTQVVE